MAVVGAISVVTYLYLFLWLIGAYNNNETNHKTRYNAKINGKMKLVKTKIAQKIPQILTLPVESWMKGEGLAMHLEDVQPWFLMDLKREGGDSLSM